MSTRKQVGEIRSLPINEVLSFRKISSLDDIIARYLEEPGPDQLSTEEIDQIKDLFLELLKKNDPKNPSKDAISIAKELLIIACKHYNLNPTPIIEDNLQAVVRSLRALESFSDSVKRDYIARCFSSGEDRKTKTLDNIGPEDQQNINDIAAKLSDTLKYIGSLLKPN